MIVLMKLVFCLSLLSSYNFIICSCPTDMKGADYHEELTPIVEDVIECTKQEQGVPAESLQLEFKHGYFKGPEKFGYDVKALEYQTITHPMVLSLSNKYKKLKVNARCDPPYFQNARENLQTFAKKGNCRVEDKYFLFVNWLEQRFFYDCSEGKWARADKNQLFPQCNVMNQKKFYRINYCRKEVYGQVEELVKQLKLKDWMASKGFLRFKHSIIYHIDAHYSIECNTAYESQLESQYLPIEKAIQSNCNLASIVKEKLHEKKNKTKDQLQLKFSPEGIEYIREGSLQNVQVLFSKAFNQFRDITNELSGQDLTKMMENLSIETKQERKKQQKVQKQQATKEIPQPRREFRKRQA